MSIPGDNRSPRNDPDTPIEIDEHGSDAIVEDTLPQSGRAPSEEAPLPDYFLAGIVATGFAAAFVAIATSIFGLQGTATGAVVGAMAGSIASQVAKKRLTHIEHRARSSIQHVASLSTADVARLIESSPHRLSELGRQIPWRSVRSAAAIGVVGFALGVMVLSVVEAASGKPVSAVTSGEPSSGTTFGNLVETAVPEEARAPRPPKPEATTALSTATSEPTRTAEVSGSPLVPTPAAPAASPVLAATTQTEEATPGTSPTVTPRVTVAASATPTLSPTTIPTPGHTASPVATTATAAPPTATPQSTPTVAPTRGASVTPFVTPTVE